ncbi:MAG TPA: hypothetical protein VKP30_33115, partial [Polyangiaceae bacterium]|nr:hypothetical protein [Polyangiaceae bacterium]
MTLVVDPASIVDLPGRKLSSQRERVLGVYPPLLAQFMPDYGPLTRVIGTQTRLPKLGRGHTAVLVVTFLVTLLPSCRKREVPLRASATGNANASSAAPLVAETGSGEDLSALEVSPWLPPYVAPEVKGFDLTKTPTLYIVNYAHLDTQWRWSFPQTIDELLPYTVHRNVQYFDRFPSHVFSWTGASRYQMIQEYYPEDFQLIQEWVKKGRWFPAGNQWEECDVLVPSSESILRQILVGSQFFKREFGTSSQEFMLPDSFGFPASLPSLLAHAGLRG